MTQDTKEHGQNLTWLKKQINDKVFISKDTHEIVVRDETKAAWIFDFRNVFLESDVLNVVTRMFWDHFKDEEACQIGGVETAAIPLITAIVLEGKRRGKEVTGFYIRKSRKKIGLMKQLEGTLTGKSIILVDDLINSGRSLIRQVELLGTEGSRVKSVFTVLRFRSPASYGYFAERNISMHSLFVLPDFSLPFQDDTKAKSRISFHLDWYFKGTQPSYAHVQPKASPLIKNGVIFFGTDNGHVWCLEENTKKVLWHQKLGLFTKHHIFTTPLSLGNYLLITTFEGGMYKLDAQRGKVIWRDSIADKITAAPIVLPDGKTVIVATHLNKGGSIIAFDALTCSRMWDAYTEKPISGTGVLLAQDRLIISDQGGTLYVIGPHGILHTRKNNIGPIIGGLVSNDGASSIFWATMAGEMYRASSETLKPTLLFSADAGIYGTPAIHKNRLIAASLDKNVYCVDADKGTLIWRFETTGRIFASPVIHQGLIYIGSNDGRMYVIEEQTGKEMGVFQTTERITSPVIVDHQQKLLVTTFANELYLLSMIQRPSSLTG